MLRQMYTSLSYILRSRKTEVSHITQVYQSFWKRLPRMYKCHRQIAKIMPLFRKLEINYDSVVDLEHLLDYTEFKRSTIGQCSSSALRLLQEYQASPFFLIYIERLIQDCRPFFVSQIHITQKLYITKHMEVFSNQAFLAMSLVMQQKIPGLLSPLFFCRHLMSMSENIRVYCPFQTPLVRLLSVYF